MCFVKCSIITLYMRLFHTTKFKRVGWCLIAFSVCWALSGFLGNLLQCLPPQFFYDKSISGHCIDPRPFFVSIGSISFVEDVVILSMPMPMIWNLSINFRRKIALTAIFTLGALYVFVQRYFHYQTSISFSNKRILTLGFLDSVCVTSILRLTTFKEFNKTDVTCTNTFAFSALNLIADP